MNDKDEALTRVEEFLQIENQKLSSSILQENVKELCVAKLCDVLGISCCYNYKCELFDFFSCIMGEAVCQILNIKVHIAQDCIRFVKYKGINFIDKSIQIMNNESIDEAVLDIFNFVDENKELISSYL